MRHREVIEGSGVAVIEEDGGHQGSMEMKQRSTHWSQEQKQQATNDGTINIVEERK